MAAAAAPIRPHNKLALGADEVRAAAVRPLTAEEREVMGRTFVHHHVPGVLNGEQRCCRRH